MSKIMKDRRKDEWTRHRLQIYSILIGIAASVVLKVILVASVANKKNFNVGYLGLPLCEIIPIFGWVYLKRTEDCFTCFSSSIN